MQVMLFYIEKGVAHALPNKQCSLINILVADSVGNIFDGVEADTIITSGISKLTSNIVWIVCSKEMKKQLELYCMSGKISDSEFSEQLKTIRTGNDLVVAGHEPVFVDHNKYGKVITIKFSEEYNIQVYLAFHIININKSKYCITGLKEPKLLNNYKKWQLSIYWVDEEEQLKKIQLTDSMDTINKAKYLHALVTRMVHSNINKYIILLRQEGLEQKQVYPPPSNDNNNKALAPHIYPTPSNNNDEGNENALATPHVYPTPSNNNDEGNENALATPHVYPTPSNNNDEGKEQITHT